MLIELGLLKREHKCRRGRRRLIGLGFVVLAAGRGGHGRKLLDDSDQ
jgi:hypothetical protein